MSDRISQLATDFTELINAFYRAPRYHIVCELMLLCWVFWLIFFRKPKILRKPLTEDEKQELIDEWYPEPLVQTIQDEPQWLTREIEGPLNHIVKVNEKECINFASFDFLNMIGSKRLDKAAIDAVDKYGVGSCGPRSFYGTIDIHLELEQYISQLFNVQETVLYSYAFSMLASVIPSYAKKGDVIFADRCINYALQKGVVASRANVQYFDHNDMQDLTRLLEQQKKKDSMNYRKAKATRRFVVVESLYLNTGLICPIADLVDLRTEYKFRLILDESLGLGILGCRGKGICEQRNIDRSKDVDIICGSLEYAFGSVGGFSSGSSYIVSQQRLSSLAYCFSASLPPLLAASAMDAMKYTQTQDGISDIYNLGQLSRYLHNSIESISDLEITGERFSPIKHLRISKTCFYKKNPKILTNWNQNHSNMLDEIVKFAQLHGFLLTKCSRLADDCGADMYGTIRLTVSVACTEEEINQLALLLRRAVIEIVHCYFRA